MGRMLTLDDRPEARERHIINTNHTDYQGPHNWRQCLRHVRSLSPTAVEDGDPRIRTVDNTERIIWQRNHGLDILRILRNQKDRKKQSREDKLKIIPSWKKDLIEKKKKRPLNPVNGISDVFKRRAQSGNESPFTQQVVNNGPSSPGAMSLTRRRFSPSNSFRTHQSSGMYAGRRLISPNISSDLTSNSELTRKRIERVQRARLYLLQLTGPNSFLIGGDSPMHKFKVIIGPQKCSCGRSPHCVHVLFVMLRVFKVKETDPCLWSKTLKNYEVENLFRMYNDRRELLLVNKERSKKPLKKQMEEKTESLQEKLAVPAESDTGSSKDDEDTCPICLLEMLEGESLVRCLNGCQNRLHHHCISVWFEECHNQSPLICPICRTKWKSKIEDDNESSIGQGGSSSPLIPDDLRLPYAEPIPAEHRDTARPWIQILGEDLVCCLFSRNWSIREAALKHLSREMVSTLLRGAGEGRMGALISSSQQTATHLMLECCCSVLAFMCADPVYKVFISCLKTLRAMLSYTPCRDEQQRNRLQIILKPVIEAIIIKCTDGNRRTSQLSLSTMVELTKGQDGELAVGREIVSPGSGGLGGITYILKVVLEEYQANTVPWQWLLGRLYVLDRLLEEFPGEFVGEPEPQSESSGEESNPLPSENTEGCRIIIVARFAVYAVGNNHSRIAKIARRIFFICVKFSAAQDEIVIQLNNLLVTTVEPKLMRPMRKKLARIVDNLKLSETVKEVRRDSESSQSTSCVGTSATASPNETPLSTPPNSPFPPPTMDPPPMLRCPPPLENNNESSFISPPRLEQELRPTTISVTSKTVESFPTPPYTPEHSACRIAAENHNKNGIASNSSLGGSPQRLQNVSVMCSVTLATSDHSGECTVEEIRSILEDSKNGQQKDHECGGPRIVCQTNINNCSNTNRSRSHMTLQTSTATTTTSSSSSFYDSHHMCSTPIANTSSHSSSTLLTEDLSDLTVSPPGSNGPSISFKTEISTPKGSPASTGEQKQAGPDQYCCKEEVEREEAVALAKALEASSKQEPCPLVPGLTPSDKEEVITIRIQPEGTNQLTTFEGQLTSTSRSSGSNSNSQLYMENCHWVRSHLLGTGAFSSCYQARDVKTGTLMAVKQISFCRNTVEEQDKVIKVVTEEIRMMAELNHPNVVRIMGATRQGCHFNMFVEWMPGGSVANLLAKYGAFSETVVINYTHQVLRGLTYLHENHVLHRDLKGANLLVDSTGQRVRIGDFGAAARLASQSTGAGEFQGQLLGTIAFMAPEVLRGESYGRGCDVWSVGCAMIEMTTTKPPWNANDISNHLALIFRIASSVRPPPIPENLSPGVRDVMLRCLEVKSEDRPSAKELLTHPVFIQHLTR